MPNPIQGTPEAGTLPAVADAVHYFLQEWYITFGTAQHGPYFHSGPIGSGERQGFGAGAPCMNQPLSTPASQHGTSATRKQYGLCITGNSPGSCLAKNSTTGFSSPAMRVGSLGPCTRPRGAQDVLA